MHTSTICVQCPYMQTQYSLSRTSSNNTKSEVSFFLSTYLLKLITKAIVYQNCYILLEQRDYTLIPTFILQVDRSDFVYDMRSI